jgi:hypothetical protein
MIESEIKNSDIPMTHLMVGVGVFSSVFLPPPLWYGRVLF